MYTPMILKRGDRRYILEKVYHEKSPNGYALYSNLSNGIRECFTFHELGMIEQMAEPPKYYGNPEKVKF